MSSPIRVASALRLALAVSASLLTLPAAHAAPAAPAAAPPAHAAGVFATVGDTVISRADYQRALAVAVRKKYYHAKPPEAEFARFQREVGDEVVNRVLLLAEARRRGIVPDREQIAAAVAGYDSQYAGSANWQANRDKMLAAVLPQLESESLLERLGLLVKRVPEPAEPVLRAYFEQHPDLFVEPEQVRLSVILLKVDPSSPQAMWDAAHAEGRRLHQRLLAGADFGDLARLHSGDRSAAQGGQMDYVHRGMLPEAVHGVVDRLQPAGLSEPVQMLEGVAILRLDDRRPARQRAFEQVRPRAVELWQRDEGQARWRELIDTLRRGASIRIDESLYAPLSAITEKARAG
jgi:parvulin-like peptidyl-prolyl isomerase